LKKFVLIIRNNFQTSQHHVGELDLKNLFGNYWGNSPANIQNHWRSPFRVALPLRVHEVSEAPSHDTKHSLEKL